MKTLTNLILIVLLTNFAKAQTDTLGHSKYRCEMELNKSPYFIKGEIFSASDSTLVMKHHVSNEKFFIADAFNLENVPPINIDNINIYKKGSSGNGLLVGGCVGMLIGGLIGLASGDDKPNGQYFQIRLTAGTKATLGGIVGFVPGALIGLIAGCSYKIVIPIKGKKENYTQHRKELVSYSIRKGD